MILLRLQKGFFMARGGKREGSGSKSVWKNSKTKVVRVPDVLADKILEIARLLDSELSLEGVTLSKDDSVTQSKVIDLSGVTVRLFSNGSGVYLADLVKAGYILKPDNLAKIVERKINSDPSLALKREVEEAINQLSLNLDKT
jgi:hypothetical protein